MTIKISEVRVAFEAIGTGRESIDDRVTTHNAMPVFLEIVEAALAVEVARGIWRLADEAVEDDLSDEEFLRRVAVQNAAHQAFIDAKEAYRAALAKVTR